MRVDGKACCIDDTWPVVHLTTDETVSLPGMVHRWPSRSGCTYSQVSHRPSKEAHQQTTPVSGAEPRPPRGDPNVGGL